MTGAEIYNAALALIPADGYYADYSGYVVRWVNMMAWECLAAENSIRVSDGAEPLDAAPRAASANDTVPYHDAVTEYAMPRGMAALIARDMDNAALYAELRSQYISAMAEISRFNTGKVENIY